ncbi:hypothetical protein HanXRQr2_Chr15g0693851 [Helianthus annuus]|uniref:Uncharacterized protein n=1 Tax=Helianthus annuus TaxID=4232 RepID=A0A251S8Q1_HELAN|nr:hypothetical protein HanXRQr2_Chr15g0693851 [Helianthus annuus]
MCHFVRIFIFLINPKVKLNITCSKRSCRQNLSISLPCRSKYIKNPTRPPTLLSLSSASSSSFHLYHLFSIFSFPF